MIRLLVIADDFTGALDTGVQFVACGAATRVVTDRETPLAQYQEACQVLVVDTETRHVSAEEAYGAVAKIGAQAAALGIPYIYKKTDSALRGNVGAELTALLDASGQEQLPFLPAFPQMGRNTVGGIHYIGEKPVAESVFGADPFDPVRHSRVADLIAEQSPAAVTSCPALAEGELPIAEKGIWVFDASSAEDLARTGRGLLAGGKLSVMAGCAGFASVLPNLLDLGNGGPAALPELDPNFLVVCGSVNPITVAQLDRAEEAGFLRIRLTPEQKLEPDHWDSERGMQAVRELKNTLQSGDCRIIDTNDADGNKATAAWAAERGMTTEEVRQAVSRSVGTLVSRLFPEPGLGTLLITGGDTLIQCMAGMGIREIEPVCELDRGVVLSRFAYRGVTRHVISKSGGFGGEDLLLRLADRIAQNT